MARFVIIISVLIVSFISGWYLSGVYFANKQMTKAIKQYQQNEKDITTNIALRKRADSEQQKRLGDYYHAKEDDAKRTENLLNRVLDHFDSLQQQINTKKTETTDTFTANSCRIERNQISQFSQQLRSILKQYGNEAKRADENTRLLNLCIIELGAKEQLFSRYK
ncbi:MULTISPECIES: hypothetical protein [unclassified Arsenophonus]|uniref:hypothetical protein n=1 Tax=unclassified Arsenophonus TaxID=2627083 RepID=UPI00285DB9E9|nr:hypothetical protein [Arsenophonus sp.]MDR5610613.1 hypothetical protein [Arsenophonus sp.]MDR5614403.1 hypothetical protein [Arsenophonus sp.]